ncbi:hypothetical protein NDU88_007050 [Pleurodeles waltl]|uniref:Uncharacterized protein n=1 Tax=Pleurodeles waltl TaxID=8319 RepID=A0AAV7PT05_PLEWA|nr:hypothetical protein NDU88_007050 [Pleurodeles waltl]
MEHYTTPVPLPQGLPRSDEKGDNMRVPVNPEEPSRAELLAAIQGSRVALEGKIETVAVEVNLLLADLRKVSDKVTVAEGSIVKLQMEVGALRKQMVKANSTVGQLEAWLEDAEGRSVVGTWVDLMGKVRDIMVSPRAVISPSAVIAIFPSARVIVSLPGLGKVPKRRPSAPES